MASLRTAQVPGINHLIESILPYSERHYTRVEKLVKASYFVDYTLRSIHSMQPLHEEVEADGDSSYTDGTQVCRPANNRIGLFGVRGVQDF